MRRIRIAWITISVPSSRRTDTTSKRFRRGPVRGRGPSRRPARLSPSSDRLRAGCRHRRYRACAPRRRSPRAEYRIAKLSLDPLASFAAPHYSVILPSYTRGSVERLITALGEVTQPVPSQEGAVTDHHDVAVTLPADVNQVDETGFVWAFLEDAAEPDRVRPGSLIVAGGAIEPFLARVVDLVDGPNDTTIVHLDVVGVPDAGCRPRGRRCR